MVYKLDIVKNGEILTILQRKQGTEKAWHKLKNVTQTWNKLYCTSVIQQSIFNPKSCVTKEKNVTQLKTYIRANTEQICVTVPRFSHILYRTTPKIHSKIIKCSIYRYYRQFTHNIKMIQSNTVEIYDNLVSKWYIEKTLINQRFLVFSVFSHVWLKKRGTVDNKYDES